MGKPDLSERCYTAHAKLQNATSGQICQEVAQDFLRKYLEMRVFPSYLQASFKQPFGTENEALSNRWKAVREDCRRNLLQLLLDETIRLSQLHTTQIGPLRQAMREAADSNAELKEAKAALKTVTEKVKTSETRNNMAKLRDIKASRHPRIRRTQTAKTEPRPSTSVPPRRENPEKTEAGHVIPQQSPEIPHTGFFRQVRKQGSPPSSPTTSPSAKPETEGGRLLIVDEQDQCPPKRNEVFTRNDVRQDPQLMVDELPLEMQQEPEETHIIKKTFVSTEYEINLFKLKKLSSSEL